MVKYLGDGKEILYGVPMRDMTDEEWAALPQDLQEFALATGRFEVDKPKASKPAAEDKGKGD